MKVSALALIILLCFSSMTLYSFGSQDDGFGDHEGFGDEDLFGTDMSQEMSREGFFIHDTLFKTLLLGIFFIFAFYVHKRKRSWRRILLLLSILVLGFYVGGFLCPLSVVMNVLARYNTFFLVLFAIPVVAAFFRGRFYCSYICPFGAPQELIYQKRIAFKIPLRVNGYLHKVKYLFLLYLILRFLVKGEIILVGDTPFKALFLFGGNALSITLTIVTLLLSMVLFRPFCQYFCPFGALMGLVSSAGQYTMIPKSCTHCGRCSKACPVRILEKGQLDKKECLLCGECLKECPRVC